jgi:excisionase family DNA binding protein
MEEPVTEQRSGFDRRRTIRPGSGRRATDQAWDTRAIAECIGMSLTFVQDEIRAGQIRGAKFGRHWRVHRDDVLLYLKARNYRIPPSLLDPTD